MPVAIPDLAVFVVLLGALIVCYLAVYFAKAFAGITGSTLGKLPIVGGWIDSGIHSVERKIVAIFSQAASGVQSAMGWSWHLQARIIDALGREISSHANQLWLLAQTMPSVAFVAKLIADLAKHGHSITKLWHTLFTHPAALIRPIVGELKALERWTYPRVKGLEREIEHTIPKDIAGLRSRTKTIEGELSRLWDAIRANEQALATTAFVGAVALALSRLGLGWLRCNSATQLAKKHGCSLWSKLEQLLPLGALLVIAFDFPDFCRAARVVAAGIGESVAAIEGVFDPQLEPLPPPRG